MIIGINASWMTPGPSGGLEWYCRNLISQLAVLDQQNQYVLVTAPNNYKTFKRPGSNWKIVVYEGTDNAPGSYLLRAGRGQALASRLYRRVRDLFVAPRWSAPLSELIATERLDVWFCPLIYALPLDTDVPIVTCMPDLQQESWPEFFTAAERAQRMLGYQHSCMSSAAVVAISEFTAREIRELYGVDAQRVIETPLGLDASFVAAERNLEHLVSVARLKFRLEGDYVFYPAAGWPHKNHETLIRGVAQARDRGFTDRLVFTGWPFDVMTRLRPLLDELNLRDRISHLGFVSRDDVVGILGGAKALVFPSLFEGFGLPVVEAMHLGVPVACANRCSLPEVGGDAVEYFDPTSPDEIADAILQVTGDAGTRARLSKAGPVQAAKFDYRRTAEETLRVFRAVGRGELRSPGLLPFRPVIAHNWILDGHSRWYFHCADLAAVDIELDQPTPLPELANQHVRVLLDGVVVIDDDLPPSQPRRYRIPPGDPVTGGFHQLEVIASSKASISGEVLSARVLDLIVEDHDGTRTKLVP